MPLPEDWKNAKLKRLDQQVAMTRRDFMLWMTGKVSDKSFSFKMSNHLAAFNEILKGDQD